MTRRVVVVEHMSILDFKTDAWCADCNLSSGVVVHYAVQVNGRLTMSTARKCHECGSPNVQEES